MTESSIMTAKEVAALWGVSVMTVHRWVNSGQFDEGVVMDRLANNQLVFDRAATVAQHERETAQS